MGHHRAVHAERLKAYRRELRSAEADSSDPYRPATLGFGIAYERAVLSWFDSLPASIRGPGT